MMTLTEFNVKVKETIDSYYKTHSPEDFFAIDDLLSMAREDNLTSLEVPQLIEMQNIIVLG